MRVKYLPYPPLQRIVYSCDNCKTIAVVLSHYPQACTVRAWHDCPRTKQWKELQRQ